MNSRLSAAILSVLVGTSFAVAQPADITKPPAAKPSEALSQPAGPRPPDFKGKQNAALVYYRAWDSIDRAVFADVNENYKNEPGAKLSDRHLSALKDNQRFVGSLMHAAGLEDCDWGVNFEEGPNALLPHLALLRGSCRFLGADVRRCVQEGDANAAAKRIVAVVQMSTQERNDRCLISSLVAVAINGYAISLTRNTMTEKSLTPQAAHVVLAAFRAMPEDPFGFKNSLDMEKSMLDWTRKHFTGEHAGKEFSEQYLVMGDNPKYGDTGVEKMNQQELSAELDRTQAFYDELDKLWGRPGKEKEIGALEARIAGGEFGSVAKILAPAVGKANQSGLKSRAAADAIIKDLEAYIRAEAPKAEPATTPR
jgi:hypothetical protein